MILAAALFAATLCQAVAVDLHVGSYHTADAGYSNANYGLGGTCFREGYSVGAGVYRNSFGKASGYVMAHVETKGQVRVGAGLGAVFGGYDSPVKPIAGVTLSADFLGVTGRVLVGPTIEKRGAVFHFVISKELE